MKSLKRRQPIYLYRLQICPRTNGGREVKPLVSKDAGLLIELCKNYDLFHPKRYRIGACACHSEAGKVLDNSRNARGEYV